MSGSFGNGWRLPTFDPHWNRQCLECLYVAQQVRNGIRILRCQRAPIVGGGGQRNANLRRHCIDVIDEDCKHNDWFTAKDDNR